MGPFRGAQVETLLSGAQEHSFAGDIGPEKRSQQQMRRWIANNEIKYTEPNQVVTTRDLFRPDGRAYAGVVRWLEG